MATTPVAAASAAQPGSASAVVGNACPTLIVAAGFAGIVALALVRAQPLLAGGCLPGLPPRRGRYLHRFVGVALIVAILAHVGGLWLTSPPDVIDALLFDSPAPFSVWGVLAMWAAFAAALLAALRRRLRAKIWRLGHTGLVLAVVLGSVLHALLIEGAMETVSKAALCALVVIATARAVFDLRVWLLLRRSLVRRPRLTCNRLHRLIPAREPPCPPHPLRNRRCPR